MSSKNIFNNRSWTRILQKNSERNLPDDFINYYKNLEIGERSKLAKILDIPLSSLTHIVKGSSGLRLEQAIIIALLTDGKFKIEDLRPDLKSFIKTSGVSECRSDQIEINIKIMLREKTLEL